ncbi:MAG: hypothetical protein PHT54_01055 [Candidatus Nanoarchaeia archaeon]|nr:hypothetical protein [Candidatus Nanoarchaeia archaeon]
MKNLEERKEKPEFGQILKPYLWSLVWLGVAVYLALLNVSPLWLRVIVWLVCGFIVYCAYFHYLIHAIRNRPKEKIKCPVPGCGNKNINWFSRITKDEDILPLDMVITTSDGKFVCDRCRARNNSI